MDTEFNHLAIAYDLHGTPIGQMPVEECDQQDDVHSPAEPTIG